MTPSDLGRKLVDHDGITDPSTRKQRRQQMEAILERERTTLRSLRRGAIAAWITTLLIPAGAMIMAVTPAQDDEGLLAAILLFGLIGGIAFVLAVLFTIGWMFRSRVSTMSAIEMRLAAIEDLIEHGRGSADED